MTEEARLSWRRILVNCAPRFLARNSRRSTRIKRVAVLCGAVRDCVLRSICFEVGGIDANASRQFVDRLPDVLGRCDEDIYDAPFAAEAYAFVHLVDRYRRFWDVLEELARAGNLPVRDSPLDVLDIGTGPASALYAVNDFFEELRAYSGRTRDCQRLKTPPPRLRSIEASEGMVRLVHRLSEITSRPGPFQPDRANFDGFNPPEIRAAHHRRIQEELVNDWDYSEQAVRIQASLEQEDWQGDARYHICVLSNFLTSQTQVQRLASELTHVFGALKPRGIVIVVGGSGADYPMVYESLDKVAKKSNVRRVNEMPATLPCHYNNAEAEEIKKMYRSVFEAVQQVVPLHHLEEKLPGARDLWDPDTPLNGPKAFGVRVYQALNKPPFTRFTKHRSG